MTKRMPAIKIEDWSAYVASLPPRRCRKCGKPVVRLNEQKELKPDSGGKRPSKVTT